MTKGQGRQKDIKHRFILLCLFMIVLCTLIPSSIYAINEGNIVSSTIVLVEEEMKITQYEEKFKLMRPIDVGYISSGYERRWGRLHTGVDIAAPRGTPIYASESGIVELSGWDGSYGKCVIINHENGVKTRYAHQSKIIVKEGQRISRGDVIGYVGSTGNSTGYHLHFEVIENGKTVDPTERVKI